MVIPLSPSLFYLHFHLLLVSFPSPPPSFPFSFPLFFFLSSCIHIHRKGMTSRRGERKPWIERNYWKENRPDLLAFGFLSARCAQILLSLSSCFSVEKRKRRYKKKVRMQTFFVKKHFKLIWSGVCWTRNTLYRRTVFSAVFKLWLL